MCWFSQGPSAAAELFHPFPKHLSFLSQKLWWMKTPSPREMQLSVLLQRQIEHCAF